MKEMSVLKYLIFKDFFFFVLKIYKIHREAISDTHQVKDIQLVVGSDPPIFELNPEVSCVNNQYRKLR